MMGLRWWCSQRMEGPCVHGPLCEESHPVTKTCTLKKSTSTTCLYLSHSVAWECICFRGVASSPCGRMAPNPLSSLDLLFIWLCGWGFFPQPLTLGSAMRLTVVNGTLINITQTNTWKNTYTFTFSLLLLWHCHENKPSLACWRMRHGNQSWVGTDVSARTSQTHKRAQPRSAEPPSNL